MAETQGFKARVEYEVTDGTQLLYTFPFSYLRKKFIKVDVLHADNSITSLTYGVDYVVNDLSLTLTNPVKVGEHLIIYRQTTTDKIITWNDGSILLASDMNTEDVQMLHLQEEQQDYIQSHSINTKTDSDTKEVLWDALNHRVINVSDPKDPQDAVTKAYMENVQGGFVAANTKILNEAKDTLSATQQTQSKAQASEALSKAWSTSTESPDNAEDTQSSTGKTQSSRSWALYSEGKAQESATSEVHAKTSETNAKDSETKARLSEQNAKVSETNAKTSETKAATSEANAKTSETNAKSSETKSKDSENAARVSEQNAAESARVAMEYAMDFNMLKRNKEYAIGDIAYSSYLPSWARLECVTAGTTADTVPPALCATHIAGQYITDGTAIFILDDVRDGNRVGDIVLKPTLNDGYIKANGAVVKASEYPRLLKFVQDNNLCVSDSEWSDNSATKYVYGESEDSLKVPNVVGRVLQGWDELTTKSAGLPNITGYCTASGAVALTGLTGAFYGQGNTAPEAVNNSGRRDFVDYLFDASRSNSIYGNSDTVQPPACCLIAQIKY